MSEEMKNLNNEQNEQPVEEKKVEEKVAEKQPVSKKTIGIIAGAVAAVAVVIAIILAAVLGGGSNNPGIDNGGNVTPPAVSGEYTLGMGIVVSLNSSATNNAQVDATVAVVVLDKDGKIVDCKIDVAQNVAKLSDGSYDFTKLEKTKKELGYDYNMSKYGSDNNGDGVVKEWFEQAKLFEEYVVGMTGAQVEAIETKELEGHIVSADDALLTAGCTMQITDFIDAIAKACKDDQAVTFETDKAITLGVAANSYDGGSKAATEDADGEILMYTDFGAVAVVDGKIAAALNDAIQPKVGFDIDGEILSKTFKGTKRELKEDYNMSKYGTSLVGNATVVEWYLQSAAFSKHIVGLTPAQVVAMPTQVKGEHGYIISADDALLSAGCTMSIDAIIDVVAKAAGYVAPAASEEDYTLGMGVEVSLNSSATNNAQVDATVAVVVLDKDGKIVFCRLDVAQNVAKLSDGEFNFTKLEKTKMELGYDYNMSKYGSDNNDDGIVKEWFEQAQIFENYVVGKTVAEVQAIGTKFVNNHYIASDESLLTAGCTMQITDFITAIVKACNDDQAVTFKAAGEFTLGVIANSYDGGSKAATEEDDGEILMYSDFGAVVLAGDTVLASLNDAIQPKIGFDIDGEILSKTFKGTKRELKEDYNMAKYGTSLVGNATVVEWYLQSAAFSAHVAGKTVAEIESMPTQVKGDHNYIISADDTLLSAGCTMSIDAIIDVVVEAAANAR